MIYAICNGKGIKREINAQYLHIQNRKKNMEYAQRLSKNIK